MEQTPFKWTFERLGGTDQVVLTKAEELPRLRELDPKLWVALACPTKGMEFDADTLRLVDADHDGRIRIRELLDAVEFACRRLTDPAPMMASQEGLAAAQIADPALAEAARSVLLMNGLGGDGVLTLGMVRGADAVRASIAHGRWQEAYDASPRILGEATQEAWSLYRDLAPKIDDYFLRCRMAAFAPDAASALNADAALIQAAGQPSLAPSALGALPLAHVSANGRLTAGTANPLRQEAVGRLIELTGPLLAERGTLTAADWSAVRTAMEAHGASLATEPVVPGGTTAGRPPVGVDARIDDTALADLERLLLYTRHLHRLLDNFVSFREFFSMRGTAAFQAGTLYIDGRACRLCLTVADQARHVAIARHSHLCLIYCGCRRGAGGDARTMDIVAAVTSGGDDFLIEGRNGVFIDNDGNDWDATLTRIERSPICIRDALWSPYKRISRILGSQLAKAAADKGQAQVADLGRDIGKTVSTMATPQKAPAAPFDIGRGVGAMAAVGIAIGALGTALGSIASALLALRWWQPPLLILGLFATISGPSVLSAWLNLRQRTLAPLLEASGWALNSALPIGLTLANELTVEAAPPRGATVRRGPDPLRERKRPRPAILLLLLLVLLGSVLAIGLWSSGLLSLPLGS